MASTATFSGPCSFDEISYYIFAHFGLYFVDNGMNLLFEFLNWMRSNSINLIFHVTRKKKVFSCHLSKNDISYYDSCQNSGLFKMKPLIGKLCI